MMKKEKAHNNVRILRINRGVQQSQLALMTGIKQSALSKIEKRQQNISRDQIEAIKKALNVTEEDIFCNPTDNETCHLFDENKSIGQKKENIINAIAFIEVVTAHLSSGEVITETKGFQTMPTPLLKSITSAEPKNIKIMEVKNDCMYPTIKDGDWVWVDSSIKKPKGDGIYMFRVCEDIVFKRVIFDFLNNKAKIVSDNAKYPALETDQLNNLNVLGKVICINSVC